MLHIIPILLQQGLDAGMGAEEVQDGTCTTPVISYSPRACLRPPFSATFSWFLGSPVSFPRPAHMDRESLEESGVLSEG